MKKKLLSLCVTVLLLAALLLGCAEHAWLRSG